MSDEHLVEEEQNSLNRREQSQFDILMGLRETDPKDRDKAYVSDALIFCPLPFRRTRDRQIIETAKVSRDNEIEVIFTATGRSDLAHGQDAHLLDVLMSESKRLATPEISMNTLNDVTKLLGVSWDGGNIYRDLRRRIDRISDLHIKIVVKGEVAVNIRVVDIQNLRLPSRADVKYDKDGQQPLFPFVFRFAKEFYEHFVKHYTAIPSDILKAFSGSPVEYSLAKFIYRRVLRSNQSAFIPLKELQRERGSVDTNLRRFRAKLKRVIKKMETANPELKGVLWVKKDGLHILSGKQIDMLPERVSTSA